MAINLCFVQIDAVENMGIMYLSAAIKKAGHNACLIITRFEKDLLEKIRIYDPRIIAFSSTTGRHVDYLELATKIKSVFPRIVTIMGGAHATFSPDVIEHPCLDMICRGEGELALCELLQRMEREESLEDIKNLWLKKKGAIVRNPLRSLISDLDTLAHPDRDLYYQYEILKNHPSKYFFAGRGCPFECSFCHNHALKKLYEGLGDYIRLHSPEYVIEDIRLVQERYKLRTAIFTDDQFCLDKLWLKKFLPLFSRLGIKFNCSIRADVMDEDSVKLLAENNCYSVCFGVESGVEEKRKLILNKSVSDKQIFQLAAWLHKYRIPFLTNNMMGFPGETLKDALETMKLNAVIRTDFPWCSIFQPYPMTKLSEDSISQGFLIKNSCSDSLHSSFFRKSLLNMDEIKQICRLQKLFFWGVRFPCLISIIKAAVYLPLMPFYEVLFILSFGIRYKRSNNLTLMETFSFGWHTLGYYFLSKGVK